MPEHISIEVASDQKVTAIIYAAAKARQAGIGLILGPGAGAPQTSGFMVTFASELAARGIDVVTFNFLYMEQRRRVPDSNAKLEACYRAVIEAVARRKFGKLVIGGKSMGGRIASQVAALGAADVAGLVLLDYPLHPPGKPEELRVKHLPAIETPMLFVQGSRDAFGTPEELRPFMRKLKARAELHVVEGGDHSLKVPKRSGLSQADVYKSVQDRIDQWLRAFIE